MIRIYLPVLFLFLFTAGVFAQEDTIPPIDTNNLVLPTEALPTDTGTIIISKDTITPTLPWDIDMNQVASLPNFWWPDPGVPLYIQVMNRHPYFGFGARPSPAPPKTEKKEGKELIFYLMVAFLLVFAFLKTAFGKYLNDLIRLLFRPTLKQRQIREQLMQTPLPSLLFNGFFVLTGGLYINFMLLHFDLIREEEFWLFYLYSCLGLASIYLVKFLGLKILGWIFNLQEAAASYIFIVFIINKVMGIFLLPFLILLAFLEGNGYTIALVFSWFGVATLILYRFILTYGAVRNQVKFNPFHFFLYLCAFEIAPLLLIYKLLLVFFQ